ncbi:hypothetical protein MKX08_000348 [Trichoderma sp. CBMAI-0020]|nr:hypothetical protein MKX08_000348 [Trichoderma sp. CBMAI-0020]
MPILRKADSAKFWRGKKLEREPLIGVNSSRSAQAKYLAIASGPNLSNCSFLMTDDLRPMVWPPSLFTADGGDMRITPMLGRGLDAWPLRNRCCYYTYREYVNNPVPLVFSSYTLGMEPEARQTE